MGLFDRRTRQPEQRDPKGATTSIRYHGKGMPLVAEWNADQAIRLGYLANVIAYRCIQIIADTGSQKPFRAGLAQPAKAGGTAEHNPNARLAQLLGPPPGGPAKGMTARGLWRWTIIQRLATGRNGWEIELDRNGGIVAFWPLVSARLKAIPSDGGSDWFARFDYGRDDKLVRLTPEQVHYGWTPHPSDFRQPLSPLTAARYDLSIAEAVDRHALAFVRNNAVPAHIVGIEQFDTAEQFEAFKRQWNAEYRGPDAGGKTHFVELEPGDDGKLSEAIWVQTLGVTAKDARLIEQHKATLERVAMSLGVPWSKLDTSGRTYENADAEDAWFWESTMAPLLSDLADEVNMGIAPRLGGEVGWFDLSDVRALQPRPPADATSIPGLITAGVIHPAEARPWLGLSGDAPDPTPDPANVEVPSGQDPVERGADGPAGGAGGEGRRAGEAEAEGGPPEGRREAVAEGRATVDQEARRRALWTAHDTAVTALERQFERAFRRLFKRQQDSAIQRLEANARSKRIVEGRARADEVFDPGFWTAQTVTEAQALFEALQTAAFVRLSERFGISFDLEAEYARTFIEARANQLAGQVTQTTYDAIKGQLSEGVAAGEDIPSISRRVRSVFADATATRATTIARTEVIGGFGAATRAAITGLPASVVAGVQWISTRDGRTRDSHAAADGQIVSVAAPFQIGGSSMLYPGDPSGPSGEVVNCRCALAALTPDEFEAEAAAYAAAPPPPIPLDRAKAVMAMVAVGDFDEVRVRRALAAA